MTTVFFSIRNGEMIGRTSIEKALDLPNGKYEMKIKRTGRRSSPLNRYYWGCVLEIQQDGFREKGYHWSKERIHEFNKSEFNYMEIVNTKTGEVKKAPQSTTELTNTQFIEFIERIKEFSAEWLEVYIPDPNEQMKMEY